MDEKKIAAEYSVNYIEDGMIVGLGTGSTVSLMLNKLSERIKSGLNITAVSSSQATTKLASSLGIKLIPLSEVEEIDVTIDGADEVDEKLNGIKGGGGALLYEKIIASNSKKNIWIIDSTKLVKTLGKFPLPVEIIQFGHTQLCAKLEENGFNPTLRVKGPLKYITDNNNYIVDLKMDRIQDPVSLDIKLKSFPGIVETGLFCNTADEVIVGTGREIKIFSKKREFKSKRT